MADGYQIAGMVSLALSRISSQLTDTPAMASHNREAIAIEKLVMAQAQIASLGRVLGIVIKDIEAERAAKLLQLGKEGTDG